MAEQMTLGELIVALENIDPDLVVPHGFSDPHSYRGCYAQLAFEPARDITVGQMFAAAWAALGSTYEGYKGGEFTMGPDTPCWLAYHGACGDELTAERLQGMLAAGRRPGPGARAEAPVADGPEPASVGWYCDHSGEEPGQRGHEGWRWDGQAERVWARQPTVVSAFTRPGEVRCPRAVRVYAVDVPALLTEVAEARSVSSELAALADTQAVELREAGQARAAEVARLRDERDMTTRHHAGLQALTIRLEGERDEARVKAGQLRDELAEERLTSATLRTNRDQLDRELTATRQHDETPAQVLRGVLDSVRAGRIDDDEAVGQLVQRIVRPLTARHRQARDERDSLRHLAEGALHLRMHGERAPGGEETWAAWDRDAQIRLRNLDGPASEEPC